MSVYIWREIWKLDLRPSHLLVLLALADHANKDGKSIYPSIGRIAWKSGYSTRQVQRIIKELKESQILVLVEDNSQKGKSNLYRIDLEAGKYKKPYRANSVSNDVRQNVTGAARIKSHTRDDGSDVPKDDADGIEGTTHVSYKPSINHHNKPSWESSNASADASASPHVFKDVNKSSHEDLQAKGNDSEHETSPYVLNPTQHADGGDKEHGQKQLTSSHGDSIPSLVRGGRGAGDPPSRIEVVERKQESNSAPAKPLFHGANAEVKQRLLDRSFEGRKYGLARSVLKQEVAALTELIDDIGASEEDAWLCFAYKRDKERACRLHNKSYLPASWQLVSKDFSDWVEQGRQRKYKVPGVKELDLRPSSISSVMPGIRLPSMQKNKPQANKKSAIPPDEDLDWLDKM